MSVASRFQFQDVAFNQFKECGSLDHIGGDGECLAGKGLGSVKIRVPLGGGGGGAGEEVGVEVFVTHTIAEPPVGTGYSNAEYRVSQVGEIVANATASKEQVVVVGGDFNMVPSGEEGEEERASFRKRVIFDPLFFSFFSAGTTFRMVRDKFRSAVEEVYPDEWNTTKLTSSNNPRNTYMLESEGPHLLDYIFYRSADETAVGVRAVGYEMPSFRTENGTSFSDHEAVVAVLEITAA